MRSFLSVGQNRAIFQHRNDALVGPDEAFGIKLIFLKPPPNVTVSLMLPPTTRTTSGVTSTTISEWLIYYEWFSAYE